MGRHARRGARLTPVPTPAPATQAINLAGNGYMSKQTDVNEKMRAILID